MSMHVHLDKRRALMTVTPIAGNPPEKVPDQTAHVVRRHTDKTDSVLNGCAGSKISRRGALKKQGVDVVTSPAVSRRGLWTAFSTTFVGVRLRRLVGRR